MIKQNLSRDQRGSHHVVLTLGIVVALIGVLGFVGYNSFMKRSSNAGSTNTVGRPTNLTKLAQAKKDLAKFKAQLETATADQKKAKNTYEAKYVVVDNLVSGVSDTASVKYDNALYSQLTAKKAYEEALAKAKGNQNDAAVKKAKAALDKAQKLLDQALAIRNARDAYKARLARERGTEPLASKIAAMQTEKRALVPLETAVDNAQAAFNAAKDAYDKNDNSTNMLKLVDAAKAQTETVEARNVQQEKVDAATTAYLDIVSTWDEYKAYSTNKEALVKARAELKTAKTKLQSLNKSIKSLQTKIKAKTAEIQKLRK